MSRFPITSLVSPLATIVAVCLMGFPLHASEPLQLSQDPQRAVVELWYLSSTEQPTHPEVAIFSDGRVWTHNGIQHVLTCACVERLAYDLLQTDGLSSCNTRSLVGDIQAASRASGLTYHVPGAASTFIRIRTATETQEFQCPAVGVLANRFPEVVSLQRFYAAQRRLENTKAVTQAGGEAVVSQLADEARRAVEVEYGVSVPISSQDLAMVRSLPDGSHYCQFLVGNTTLQQNKPIISFVKTPGTTPRVSVLSSDAVVR